MKKMMTFLKKAKVKAFTLVEIQVFSSEKGLEVYHGSEQLLAIKEP